ncbi:SMP-30/gluconolactonase/LRE family protein [Marinicella sp. W31]|uniref:SMP-30/gluconolactonase/LRE family protein n=1 Tax=Marinicella sp. W31 TaxID=3023713 RepID=UPI00375810FB
MNQILIIKYFLFLSMSFFSYAEPAKLPIEAEVLFNEPFFGCEGITFNGEGKMFLTCNKALWVIEDGEPKKVADLYSNLGLSAIGERDVLVADFGLENAFRHQKNHDGIVWRITPEGERKVLVKGIGDPNFILVLEDKSILISDDATNEIFRFSENNGLEIFSTAVNHPNGLALSKDGKKLYVAQIFKSIRPVTPDNSLWSISIQDGKALSAAIKVGQTGEVGANDGLVVDEHGRIYVAANGDGIIWRFDPENGEKVMIAKDIFGVASLAFGEGDYDHQSLFATTTFAKGLGGKIYQIKVGVKGQPVIR